MFTCIYPYTDVLHITPEVFKYDNILLLKQTDSDVLELFENNNIKYSLLPFNVPQYVSILEEVKKDISINDKKGVLHLEQYINYVESENKEGYKEFIKQLSLHKYIGIYSTIKDNISSILTESIAVGTIPILLDDNIKLDEKFEYNKHYLRSSPNNLENYIKTISDAETIEYSENCIKLYNDTEGLDIWEKYIHFKVNQLEW